VTIHSGHPFATPEGERDPLRRLRGRLVAPVTVWACGVERERAGLTVSSLLVADGQPGRVLGLVDPDSDFAEALVAGAMSFAISLLTSTPAHQQVADVFAGTAPSGGGPFRTGTWLQGEWGPRLADASGWVGCRVDGSLDRHVGWGILVEAVIEDITLMDEAGPGLAHRRGRYLKPE
jgi:flavin reductase (DIM6/NTAB) family NADH-FMN oxidoreductase RutF